MNRYGCYVTATALAAQDSAFEALLERVRPLIDETIERLRASEFREDPIGGRKYSRATSIVSSAYKRHGQILDLALLERLKECSRFTVWREDEFKLSTNSLRELQIHDRTEKCLRTSLEYGERERAISIDIVVYDNDQRSLKSYNVKRGNGSYDGGKRKQILGDLLRTHMLLKGYGEQRQLNVRTSHAHIIFYYGLLSISQPLGLAGAELDDHFGFPVYSAVEYINKHFRERLHDLIENE